MNWTSFWIEQAERKRLGGYRNWIHGSSTTPPGQACGMMTRSLPFKASCATCGAAHINHAISDLGCMTCPGCRARIQNTSGLAWRRNRTTYKGQDRKYGMHYPYRHWTRSFWRGDWRLKYPGGLCDRTHQWSHVNGYWQSPTWQRLTYFFYHHLDTCLYRSTEAKLLSTFIWILCYLRLIYNSWLYPLINTTCVYSSHKVMSFAQIHSWVVELRSRYSRFRLCAFLRTVSYALEWSHIEQILYTWHEHDICNVLPAHPAVAVSSSKLGHNRQECSHNYCLS